MCIGEKTMNGEDCFVLKLEAESPTLKARSSSNVEIIRHTVWGYFSQRTGLLFQLKDTHLLRIKSLGSESIFWETSMESLIQDYRTIDGVNIAHAGKTSVSLFRFGESSESHSRTRMEEVWEIDEVDFNVKGLSMDCFLPPRDLKKEQEGCCVPSGEKMISSSTKLAFKIRGNSLTRIGVSKIMAIEADHFENTGGADEDL